MFPLNPLFPCVPGSRRLLHCLVRPQHIWSCWLWTGASNGQSLGKELFGEWDIFETWTAQRGSYTLINHSHDCQIPTDAYNEKKTWSVLKTGPRKSSRSNSLMAVVLPIEFPKATLIRDSNKTIPNYSKKLLKLVISKHRDQITWWI